MNSITFDDLVWEAIRKHEKRDPEAIRWFQMVRANHPNHDVQDLATHWVLYRIGASYVSQDDAVAQLKALLLDADSDPTAG